MTNKEIEMKINKAITNAVPDVLDSVLSNCKETKGQVIIMSEKKRNPWIKRMSAIAATFVVVIVSAFMFRTYQNNNTVDSTVSLDVNPSIEIEVNQNERVIAVTAQNKDGKTVIGDMDFKGSMLDVTVNALIGSMVRNGYLNELANSILISVDNDNEQVAQALQKKLSDEVSALLKTNTFSGAVLSQTVSSDEELTKLAEQYGITIGKAQLIRQITEKNSVYTFENLALLSINELNLLCQDSNDGLESVTSVGEASDKAYIGAEKAKEIAFSNAGVSSTNGTDLKIDLDYENGIMVYEVDFEYGNVEYQYEINAVTGAVVKVDKEKDDDADSTNSNSESAGSSVTYIGEAKAKEIVLDHVKCTADSIREYSIELEGDDGIMVYDIDFKCKNYEYNYEVNAVTGAIIKHEKEKDDDFTVINNFEDENNKNDAVTTDIGEAKAKELALAHAKCSAGNISDYSIDKETDDGVTLYEIEFKCNGYEYSYDINAKTGSIIKYDKEMDD